MKVRLTLSLLFLLVIIALVTGGVLGYFFEEEISEVEHTIEAWID